MAASVYTFCIVHTYHHWVFLGFFFPPFSIVPYRLIHLKTTITQPSLHKHLLHSVLLQATFLFVSCCANTHVIQTYLQTTSLHSEKKNLSSVFLKAFPDSLTHSRWWPCFPLALCLNCSQNHSDKPRRQPTLRCLQTTLTPCGKALQLTQAPFFSFFAQPGSYSIQMSNHLPPLMGSLMYEFFLFPYIVQ